MDWQNLIRQLRDEGMTLSAIAVDCGTNTSTISEIARGGTHEPRATLAIALMRLAANRREARNAA